jgi:hypothetical protein
MTPTPQHQEYQDTLQAAAASFLSRHHGQHLGKDQLLFNRAVYHLVASLSAPTHLAEKVVSLALDDLQFAGERRLNVEASTESMVVITEASNGQQWSIPVELIYSQLIDVADSPLSVTP